MFVVSEYVDFMRKLVHPWQDIAENQEGAKFIRRQALIFTYLINDYSADVVCPPVNDRNNGFKRPIGLLNLPRTFKKNNALRHKHVAMDWQASCLDKSRYLACFLVPMDYVIPRFIIITD